MTREYSAEGAVQKSPGRKPGKGMTLEGSPEGAAQIAGLFSAMDIMVIMQMPASPLQDFLLYNILPGVRFAHPGLLSSAPTGLIHDLISYLKVPEPASRALPPWALLHRLFAA